LWDLVPVGSAYQIVAQHSQKCLDVEGRGTANGTNVQQWTCGGASNTNQLWRLVRFSSAMTAEQQNQEPVETSEGSAYLPFLRQE
jgi:hypothetical protein